jgi:iron complex outermembrane receptor protein
MSQVSNKQASGKRAPPLGRILRGAAAASAAVALLPLQVVAAELEEIVVTAQRREQSLQDVPLSVAALTAEEVRAFGFTRPQDIYKQTPNVVFGEDGALPQFNIRGVQLYDFGNGNEPPVGVYVDDVYMGTLGSHIGNMFDVERVEVVRGPQGTLFGRNTTGGLVHFINRRPSEEFGGYASLQVGSFDQRIFEGAVGGPLSDRVRGRISVVYNEDNGWQENAFTGTRYGVTDILAGRAQLEFDVTSDVTVLLNVHGSSVDNDSEKTLGMMGLLDPATFTPCPPERARAFQCVSAVGSPSTPDPRRPLTDIARLTQKIDAYGGFARITWNAAENLEFTSITAFESTDRQYMQDADASTAPVTTNLSVVTGGAVPLLLPAFWSLQDVKAEQFSQEFRLAGKSDALDWVAGAFYYDDDKTNLDFNNPQIQSALGSDLGIDNEAELKTESWALFAQTDWQVAPTVSLTAGVRFTDEQKDLGITNDREAPLFFDNESLSTNKTTFRGGINWTPLEDALLYASISSGFKSGAFKTTFAGPGQATPAAEETVLSYEIGWKSRFLDSRVQLNGAAFYNDYDDLQILTVTTIGGLPAQVLSNIGSATIYGLELDARFAFTDALTGTLGLGLLNTEMDSTAALFDGNELARAPEVSANGSLRYTLGSVSLLVAFKFLDDHFLTPENQAELQQEAYWIWDARLNWTSDSGKYYIDLFADNLTDEEYAVGAFAVGDFAFNGIFWGNPRTYGLRAGVNF